MPIRLVFTLLLISRVFLIGIDGGRTVAAGTDTATKMKVMEVGDGPVSLSSSVVTIRLKPAGVGESHKGLSESAGDLRPSDHVYIVLKDLGADAPPGVVYEVSLDLPHNAQETDRSLFEAGTINFFNLISGKLQPSFRSLDVTELVLRLHSQRLLTTPTELTFRASSNPAPGSNPRIGKIELLSESGE